MKNTIFYGLLITIGTVSMMQAGEYTGRKLPEASSHSDTVKIKETFNENDPETGNESVKDRLKPIRTNFKRINSIRTWTTVKKRDIEGESAEGGEAVFYEQKGKLEKITARLYGEMGQLLTEYYLLNGKLSFVFEKHYEYNRPLYYNEKVMKENNDTEAFDFNQSKITEDRYYFENGKLIHIINSEDCGAPFSRDYISEEQKRISEEYGRLLKLKN
ncbi:MAG: hypothetical protein LBE92_06050 [Chryseobacterium sp.]|jgi:hypothetical protein|uniref:hypothetical protein n=1 Tax=Chryseobacterium sp. TaxID=1871047 RepID=UPI0028280C91|nr:hypothetical protein [Chryseobacterium sp.]MDR2235666.1 hypothetical protein [Chryseobacterium sp.]